MSSIEKTEAVVLNAMPYRETSKIVTFYTRRFGRLSTIVKGARRPGNRYGSSLEPMSYDLIVVYKKEHRELQTLGQCDRLRSFHRLYQDLEKMSAGMGIIEMTAMVAREQEENGPLFSLLVGSLSALDAATKNPAHVLYCFEVRLATILGFQPAFIRCASCGRLLAKEPHPRQRIRYHLARGGPLCGSCPAVAGETSSIEVELLSVLEALSQVVDPLDATSINLGGQQGDQVMSFIWSYLHYHVPGLRPLKSGKVFSRILALP